MNISEEDISIENGSDDEYEEEEDEEKDLIVIQLERIQIQINFSQLCKYSALIRSKYLISDAKSTLPRLIKEFQKQYKINDDNIISFFNLLRGENCKITKQNYGDIFKLAQFFKLKKLLQKLKKYSKSHFNDLDFHIQSILNEIELAKNNNSEDYRYELTVQIENYLIYKIDQCFNNPFFEKLPISIIYQIIEKSDKKKIQSDELFDFINKSIKEFFVLFRFLDLKKLSENRFEKLFDYFLKANDDQNRQFYIQYIPCDLLYISMLKQNIKDIQDKYDQLSNENKLLNSEIQKLQDENSQLNRENNHFKNTLNQKESQMNKLSQTNKQLEISFNEEISKLKIKMKQIEDKNAQIKKKCSQHENEIDKLMDENQTIKNDKNLLEQKIANYSKSNEEFSRALNSIFGTFKERKMKAAISYLNVSSEKGNCFASYLLGILYESGEGVERNPTNMIKFYEKSSEQGNSHGFNRIGYCYDIGYVLQKNHSKAFEYYQKAAELNNSYSINNLGVLYLYGNGVMKSTTKALLHFKKSADLGNSYALRNLGDLYKEGQIVEKNIKKAIEYYQKSADEVDSHSFIVLGDLYAKGDGVKKNINKAIEYYQKAKELGDNRANNKIKSITT